MQKKLSAVAQAYQRCKAGRRVLLDVAQPMECTEDKAGIVWERFVTPHGESLILFATPSWWDVYAPLCASRLIIDVVAAIKTRAAKTEELQR